LSDLEQAKYRVTTEVQVMQSELNHIRNQIERIEHKLDKVLEK
jgi:predicted  nucleic acid-binding Zn-ribbon protein